MAGESLVEESTVGAQRAGAEGAGAGGTVWEVLRAEADRQGGGPLAVVDVGGGTGGYAVPLARAGHRVTVVDPNADALAALQRRAAEAGVAARITACQGDGDRLTAVIPAGTADLVLCHSLLEVVDDPPEVVRAVAAALRPGGTASVLVATLAAAVLGRAAAGHLDAAEALLADPDGRAGPADLLRRRFDGETVSALLSGAGLTVEEVHGVRILAGWVPASLAEAAPQRLRALEARLAARRPYRDIAAQLHVLARTPGA